MPQMRQRTADSYREIWGESGAAVLGLLGVSKVQDHAEYLKWERCMEMVVYPLFPSWSVNLRYGEKRSSSPD